MSASKPSKDIDQVLCPPIISFRCNRSLLEPGQSIPLFLLRRLPAAGLVSGPPLPSPRSRGPQSLDPLGRLGSSRPGISLFIPSSQYIASLSKDNELRLWSTSSWTCARSLPALSSDLFGSGLYKAARWAPDGAHLCVTHSVYVLFPAVPHAQTRFPAALLLPRDSLQPQAVFVGHAGLVGIARFAPALLRHASQPLYLLALGCDDGSLSVWRNDLTRPLAVIRGASRNGVADIAWSPDATKLLFTAGETCTAVEFSPAELGGEAMGGEEMRAFVDQKGREVKKKLSMLPPKNIPAVKHEMAASTANSIANSIEHTNETQSKHTEIDGKTAETNPPSIPAVPSAPSAPSIPAVPSVSAPVFRTVPPRESKKRSEVDETPEPGSRKRKKQPPPAEPAPASCRSQFPAVLCVLPLTLPFPAGSASVTFRAFSLVSAPLSDETPDEEAATLAQALDGAGSLLWSWMGQGRVAIAGMSTHHVVAVSQSGWMHVITAEGILEIPAVWTGGSPAALDVRREAETEVIGMMTVDARFTVWKVGPHHVETVETQDCTWMLREEISRVSIQFVGVSQVRFALTHKDTTRSFFLDLAGHCWYPGEQPLLGYSAFAPALPTRSLASIMASNAMFTVPLNALSQLDAHLLHRRGDRSAPGEVRTEKSERVRAGAHLVRTAD